MSKPKVELAEFFCPNCFRSETGAIINGKPQYMKCGNCQTVMDPVRMILEPAEEERKCAVI